MTVGINLATVISDATFSGAYEEVSQSRHIFAAEHTTQLTNFFTGFIWEFCFYNRANTPEIGEPCPDGYCQSCPPTDPAVCLISCD
jgi:hypothetical protein